MNTSKRKILQQLAAAGAARIGARARSAACPPRFLAAAPAVRAYRWWQRAISALVALTMFIGPITVTVEQCRAAAGVLGAGSRRLDDDAWQRLLDIASLRVRFSMQVAAAAPITDPTAPISFQPAITQSTGAGGGVPVVNITAPNAAGISLNQYQQFNVDPVGLILNNSLMSGTSLTGGNVQANPNLNGRTASVIVNQVTSTGNAYASLLNGPLEVFGAPAAVVIANPNGITTRGTGFTNTIGVTLSTGTPQFLSGVGGTATDFANAKAIGYNVTSGHLQIEGNAGVNGPGAGIEGTVGTIDLIGETIGINAPLYAGTRINAIAGRQFVMPAATDTYGTTYGTASNGSDNSAAAINAANGGANRSLAIDATAFGAMTAGQIQVISTAAGMGVRSDAQLAANAGDLLMSANGDVSVAGSAAQQQASVHSTGNVSMTGTHIGVGGYAIEANGDVTSTGSIQSGGKLAVSAGGNVNVANAQVNGDTTIVGGTNVALGDVQGGGALTVTARGTDGTGDVNLNGTSVVTGATTVQAARDVNVNGQTNSGTLQASAQRNATVNAALQTSGDLALAAVQGNVATHAAVKSGGDLAFTSGLDTAIASQATAHNAVSVQTGRDLSVSGSLASGTTFSADVARDAVVGGSLMVGTDARLDAGRNVDASGVVIVQRNGTLSARNDITGSGSIAFGQSGALSAAHDVALTGKLLANGLQVDGGNDVNLATVQAGGAFGVTAHGVAGGGDVTFNGNAAALGAADVHSARDVVVNGTLAGGAQVALAAQRNVTVNGSGTVQAVGDLAMTAATGSVASAGTLNGAGALTVQGAQDVALTGATTVTGDVTATAGHDLAIGGAFAGQGAATLTAARDIVAGGNSGFVRDATLNAGRNIDVTGAFQGRAVSMTAADSIALNDVQANAALQLATRGGDISIGGNVNSLASGTIDAARDVSVNGTLRTATGLAVGGGRNTSIGGTVQSNGDVTLTNATGALTSTGTIQSGGNLTVSAAQSVDLGTQSTSSLGNLSVDAGRDLTMNGSVVAQGNGTLSAGGAIGGAAAVAFGLAANVVSGGDTNLTGSLRGGNVQTTAGGSATLHDVQAASALALGAGNDLSVTGAVTGGADVALTAARHIDISGSLQSAGNTSLLATGGSISSTGAIASNGAFDAQAGNDIGLGGSTTVSRDTTLTAGRDVNVSGTLAGQGQGSVNAARDIVGAGTLTFAQQATLEAARDVVQQGLIQGQSVNVTAAGNVAVNNVESTGTIALRANGTNTATGAGDLRIDGSVAAAGAITALAQNDVAIGGKVASGSTVGVTAQRNVAVSGAIESVGDAALVAQQGSLNATGGINSGGKLDIATGLDLSLGASTSAVGDATLTAGRDATLNGTMVGQANGTVTAAHDINGGGKQAFAANANYTAQHDVALTGGVQAAAIAVSGGNNASLHDASSASTLTLTANGIAGEGDAGVTGSASAQRAVSVTGARDVSISGMLGSDDVLTLTAQRNVSVSGGVESNGDLSATATNGSVLLTGTTTTAGSFNSASGVDTQLGGQIAVAKQINVQAGRDIALTGALAGQLDGTLNAGRDITGAGSAAFAQVATLDAAHDVVLTGMLQGATVNVAGANNAGLGTVQAVSGNLAVTAKGAAGGGDVTFGGAATAFGAMQLQAARDVTVAGAINAGGTTTIDATRGVALAAVNSAGDLGITASGGSASAASLTTQGNLNVGAAQGIAVAGQTVAGGNALLNAGGDITLTGGIGAQQSGTLTAGGSVSAGSIAFAQQANVNAGGSIAVAGSVATNGDLVMTAGNDLSAGSVQAGGAIGLQAQGRNGAGDVMVNGALASGKATTITAARDAGVGGGASSGGALSVTAGRDLGIAGAIDSNGDATLTATAGNLGIGGAVVSTGNLRAGAGGGLALLSGGLVNGDTTLTSGGAMTLGGALFGLGAAGINAGGAIAGGGALTYAKDIVVNAGGGVALGAVQGAGKFTAVSGGDMSFGATTAVGDVSAKSNAGSVTFAGPLQSGGNVAVQAAHDVSLAGGVASMGTVNVNGINGNVAIAGVSSNGDTTLHAGQTVTLSGNSIVAGQLGVSGANATLSGSVVGSKNVTVSAQGAVDAGNASIVASQNLQVNGANVTLGNATVGGSLVAQASNQLTLAGGKAVNVVGNATLASQNGLYNAANVLAGSLDVSAPSLTNAAGASLASIGTTTINASNFTNAGLVNGTTTNVTVGGGLTNVGGSLMAVNALNINTGTLNNQNGIIFAGNPKAETGAIGDVSLTINGGNGAFYNAGGQLLAQRNMGISAVNMAFDPSQGTISQGGNLSITAGYVNVGGTWNYGGQSVSLTGLNGITNDGTITGTSPLTLTAGGSFENHGQVTGSDVTFNGTLNNAAGAVMHAGNALTLNGDTTNRGTVEAGSLLTVNGGNYDNQGATTQSKGDVVFHLGGTLQNTGGSIFAQRNIDISAGAVVNDQTAPGAATTTTRDVVDPTLLWSAPVGTKTEWRLYRIPAPGDSGPYYAPGSRNVSATLGDLLSPSGLSTDSANRQCAGVDRCAIVGTQPVAGSGSVTFGQYNAYVGTGNASDVYVQRWAIETGATAPSSTTRTFTLPTVHETITSQQAGTSGVISAGNSISLSASSLSNRGGQISAQGDITLNVQSMDNSAVAPTLVNQTVRQVDQTEYTAFLTQLNSVLSGPQTQPNSWLGSAYSNFGPIFVQGSAQPADSVPVTTFTIAVNSVAPTSTGTLSSSTPTGMIAAGHDLALGGGNLVNAGLLYAGNNVAITSGTLTNQGGNQQNYSSQVGCASGVPNSACGSAGQPRGNNPTTTTFDYSQNNATIYAGHDLVIAAGQINNTYGNLLAGHDIVIGGVGSTASSTTPAQSLNNTSGNIVAGNDIKLNVSGAITNNLPPPVPVHENYGKQEHYAGCMTAGGYKESYCEGYVDQQSGSSSVISAGNNLQINAGSLTNIGSLIAAGNNATIAVAGPVVNEAQVLNAYWHSHWVQETGMFSSDKRHDIWACGSPEQCKALYGSAYTSTGGTIDPPTPVGNIAATIQAPNLSISSNGQIQNVGNVLGTYVSLTGQKLINGITTANTYTPRVNAPSQVISLSPVDLPGLNLSVPRAIGTGALPTPVAGKASYVDASLGGSTLGSRGPQDLLNNLPPSLQPSSTLFYYNPQEEDLLLQQAALKQTGKSSFVDGLTYDSTRNVSVTTQEKEYLYQNAIDYSKAHDLQLGTALTQEQINALDKPMLWYVEQTVPDPTCHATGTASCPTITALMPQVYLPVDAQAMSAGGNISGHDVTLKFNQDGNGSILNTGSITASGTLSVDTHTLTNQANQVDVGEIWQKVDGGYLKTTGTIVQPGGFMSAANMDLNVQTLNQIGGALQKLAADGAVDAASTQAMLASLQQQLGGEFAQQTLTDHLHSEFVKQGGFGPEQLLSMAAAVALSMMGMPVVGAMVSSAMNQALGDQGFSFGEVLKAGAVAYVAQGLTQGLGLNALPMQTIGNNIATNTITAQQLLQGAFEIAGRGLVSATVNTVAYGGSFGTALRGSVVSDLAAVAASAIGQLNEVHFFADGDLGKAGYVAAHAALGCAGSAASGTGCAGGAIGAAMSATLNSSIDANGTLPAPVLTAIDTLVTGSVAGALGFNVQGAVTAAQNETLNNWLSHKPASPMALSEQQQLDKAVAACSAGNGDACKAKQELLALSQRRDAELASACAGGLGTLGCRSAATAAQAAGNDVQLVNGTVYAFDPNAPAVKAVGDSYQGLYAGSFDGQIAQSLSDALSLAPVPIPGLEVLGKIGAWLGLGAADASRLAGPAATSLDVSMGATNDAVAGAVANANFAQSSINVAGTFSAEGVAKYSQLAGIPIKTVDDLAAAIRSGRVSPSQLPVDFVVTQDGAQLILNTRTSVALGRAGVPKSEWYGANKTGVQVPGMPAGTTFNDLAAGQLRRNDVPPTGTPNLPRSKR
ncbi:two-partner secretion domain-containing protein [Burkholderia multivorans]|uniref:two-partner secretion domain-containing protein n=1 Tax=Burkholderia multivorans TaxID=87883 RepID=UPI00018E2A9B|nr:filamentous hemagglutinin N-terminal domain-containing protein [Burkholderia multivorans]EEE02316.1 filamentous hemagglutinin [Burkholderia multivorans CGD1]MDN7950129.1 filamentous hemagglutinin N-terminal domain-containing protein [Burkholderia multivorans]MDR9237060.1 Filamentous hemagglutinin [Burkholderia multivorans]MDR9267620.1 Filamentous hemagglutinin [Burkholderia multivorans]MDR9283839.1 Filamentous hemagglutinin [Burkholderia multivorans]